MTPTLPGSTAESRRSIIIDNVRTFFPTYSPSSDEVFSTLEEHIETHGYFLQREHNVDIPETGYFTSWLEYVLEPILIGLSIQHKKTNLLIDPLEEYVAISKLWFSYSRQHSFYNIEDLQEALNIYFSQYED